MAEALEAEANWGRRLLIAVVIVVAILLASAFDVQAPAFRGATLAGAVVAGLLAGYVWYLLASRNSARDARRRAEDRLEAAASAPPDEPEAVRPS